MQVTLVSTTETLDVVRKLPDGTTEEVGSYQVAISDPAFVAKAEELVREIGARGLADARYDYGDLTEKSTGLVRSALGPPESCWARRPTCSTRCCCSRPS